MNNIGERIKRRQQALDMSAERLAEIVGLSPATIYRYENNDIAHMRVNKLQPIAEALRTTPVHLMGWDDDNPSPTLSPDENDLLDDFRSLNAVGRSTALATVHSLATNPEMQEAGTSAKVK